MTAGESARDEARRSREKAERLARRAELFERGADGEARTAEVLSGLGPEWISLHDFRWPGRRLANIDHVVVGPGGVFVIDSKNWSGDIRVDGQTLRQNGRSRERAVAGAADAGLAVAELLGPYAHVTRPVLCFVGDQELCGWAREVMVCSTQNLATMLTTRKPALSPAQVADAATRLDAQLRSATAPPVRVTPPSTVRRTGPRPAPRARPVAAPTRRRSKKNQRPGLRLLAFLLGVLALYVFLYMVSLMGS